MDDVGTWKIWKTKALTKSASAAATRTASAVSAKRPAPAHESTLRTARKASCGISTRPTYFIRFLPSFCFSRSFRLRVMSPP